jgi:tetratricopeptide (TPR) repeat protein
VSTLAGSAYALQRLGRLDEAKQRIDAAFGRLRDLKAYPSEKVKPNSEADEALCALADFKAAQGKLPEAIRIYTDLLQHLQTWGVKPESDLVDAVAVSRVYAQLARLRQRSGNADPARDIQAKAVDLWQHWNGVLPQNTFVRQQLDAAARVVNRM